MSNVYAIVTFNNRYKKDRCDTETAADAWKKCEVCAIGWAELGNLKKLSDDEIKQELKNKYPNTSKGAFKYIKDFLQIEEGDLILAYSNKNIIAYIGEVVGEYEYKRSNKVGNEDEFNSANQLSVNWWNEPHHFYRKNLPEDIKKQLGIIGKTVIKIDLGQRGFENFRNVIKDIKNNS